jgi:N-acetylglucosamine kinase-like BadF-type ATPase
VTGLFLGLDGGQSSTQAFVGDEEGGVVGTGHGAACNEAGAVENAVREALDQAGVKETTFEAACFGFSGGFADKEAEARRIVRAKKYSFTHDALIALVGATGGEPGVVTIAGTGSIAFGRNREGRKARAGGWGFAFGDEGGAFDLVRRALRAALQFEEGWGTKTRLTEALTEAAGASDANDLMHRFYTAEYPRARVASFAKIVDEVAMAGDPVARDILHSAGQSLAMFAGAVRRQLFESGEEVRVSYVGGVFQSLLIRERYRMLMELEEGNRVMAPKYGPGAGALLEAYRIASVKCDLRGVPEGN